MALPGWYTSWAGGNLDGSNNFTDSWQSATPTVTASGLYSTGRSLRVSLPASGAGTPGGSASATDGTYQRCENYAGLNAVTGSGSYTWSTGFSAYFGLLVTFTSMPISYSNWQLITQWKNSAQGTPPCELSVAGGRMFFDGNNGGWSIDVFTPQLGVTYKIIMQLTLTTAASTSNINCWVNDTQLLTNAKPTGSGLMYAGQSSYWKYGCYRSLQPAPGAAVIDYGAAAVATTTYADVSDYLDTIKLGAVEPVVEVPSAPVEAVRANAILGSW